MVRCHWPPSVCGGSVIFVVAIQAKIPIGSNAQAAVAFDAVSALLKRLTEYKASTVLPKHAKEVNVSMEVLRLIFLTY